MRKLGLIGGMSWVSTRIYYDHINRIVQRRRGGMASAPMLIESVDFAHLYGLTSAEEWDRAGSVMEDCARRLEQAGAGAIVIAANSMHKVYRRVSGAVDVPVLHIAECVGEAMQSAGVTTAALLGTRNVMTESFYRERLVAHGVDLLPPDPAIVDEVDRIIYGELMQGKATRDSERALRTIIANKGRDGAKAIVLACTELEMIVDTDANLLPIFDSARIHCEAAAEWLLNDT